ncbi:MAG: hypothetical protein NZM11_00705 [Anaerolineales bacterium]|nr:hypothetical protein [Anaerolineales bacterium]
MGSLDLTSFLSAVWTSTNQWITTFGPIQALGVGLTFAVSILGFIGAALAGALRMRGR